jgi:crotonobetainyl-CoA:carnitine CoA-transferase CaiB-like acyl-CoA transferase
MGILADQNRSGLLDGIRVLDLSRVLAGPWAGQLLADYGADVIKVERPRTGDDTRGWGPPWLKDSDGNATADSAYYLAANRNKRSITIDLGNPRGAEIVRRLAESADVFLENFRVGTAKEFGLDSVGVPGGRTWLRCNDSGIGRAHESDRNGGRGRG